MNSDTMIQETSELSIEQKYRIRDLQTKALSAEIALRQAIAQAEQAKTDFHNKILEMSKELKIDSGTMVFNLDELKYEPKSKQSKETKCRITSQQPTRDLSCM